MYGLNNIYMYKLYEHAMHKPKINFINGISKIKKEREMFI